MNLTTNYLGMLLKNPIVASSSPLSHSVDSIRRLEDAGAAAVVMYSLFEEQITLNSFYVDNYLTTGMDRYNVSPDEYMNLISQAKEAVDIPIIGSLNGVSAGGWIDYAVLMQEAGADAIELNVYYIPTNCDLKGSEVENVYLEILREVRRSVSLPVSIKLSPYFSSTANIAKLLVDEGASGLVLFNRFYQPDIDLETLTVEPRLVLSNSSELRLPLRWVAILYGRILADLAITTGIHTSQDVLKSLMAGAKVTMMASELLVNGIRRISMILDELRSWMEEHEYESVAQMIGSMSQQHCAEPAAFERANYMKMLASYRPIN